MSNIMKFLFLLLIIHFIKAKAELHNNSNTIVSNSTPIPQLQPQQDFNVSKDKSLNSIDVKHSEESSANTSKPHLKSDKNLMIWEIKDDVKDDKQIPSSIPEDEEHSEEFINQTSKKPTKPHPKSNQIIPKSIMPEIKPQNEDDVKDDKLIPFSNSKDEEHSEDFNEESSGDGCEENFKSRQKIPTLSPPKPEVSNNTPIPQLQPQQDFNVSEDKSLNSRDVKHSEETSETQNWIQYEHEKSFLLINKRVSQKEAEQICRSFDTETDSEVSLAMIQSAEEQRFINFYLFKMLKVIHNVWIDVKKDRCLPFKETIYTNWANGGSHERCDCVQLMSTYSTFYDVKGSIGGKWDVVSCHKKNVVLCQKSQDWSQSQVQRLLVDIKRDVEQLKRKKAINSIPIGFVYIQLPKQSEPSSIWPEFEWQDISPEYSGLFFRVLGGNSDPFGTIQEDNTRRFKGVRSYGIPKRGGIVEEYLEDVILADNKWSHIFYGGHYNGVGISFKVSSDEVRPWNTAVRVWIRC